MQRLAIAAVVAAGLGIGALWPAARSQSRVGSPSVSDVVLERSSDGHFYADAQVNGATVHFLVDTGSTTIALSEEDARKAGIAVAPGDFSLVGEGASGMVRGKEEVIDRLALGGIEQQGVKATVIEGATTSLLGAQFLDTMDEIVIRKSEMTLRKAG
ncbi:MAG: TIGR02281 family clan AA aspartic protease [Sphingomicrobium sp.]|nr:TIGR02281 family clan AA aspartic protease [Sphingomonadales bacterium]